MRLPTAIVAGMGLNGLGVVRALSSAGVPVCALDTERDRPPMRTRYGGKHIVRALSGDMFIEDLLSFAKRCEQTPVLLLTQEASVETVSAHRDSLAGRLLFRLPSPEMTTALVDKTAFHALAERHGAPAPRTCEINNPDKLASLDGFQWPCIFKPAQKSDAYAARFKKAYRLKNLEDLKELYAEIYPIHAPMLLQEWIEGGDEAIYFCLQHRPAQGAPTSFVGRKYRSWPPRVGGTASCGPAPEASEELIRLTDAFFEAVGATGLMSMEYKRDTRSGRFVMIEPTVARTDYQEEVAALNGVNIPLAYYKDLAGCDLSPAAQPSRSAAWVDRQAEAQAAEAGGGIAVPREVKAYSALWRTSDPGPWVADMLGRLTRRFARPR